MSDVQEYINGICEGISNHLQETVTDEMSVTDTVERISGAVYSVADMLVETFSKPGHEAMAKLTYTSIAYLKFISHLAKAIEDGDTSRENLINTGLIAVREAMEQILTGE